MGDFRIVKSLIGDLPDHDTATANEALEEGDICNFDGDSELEKVDDQDTADDLVIVLADASADETGVPFQWLDPWILLEGTASGTLGDVGDLQEISVDTNVITVAAATGETLKKFMIRKIINASTKKVWVTRWQGLAT